jgi:hypothetical protein
MLGKLLKYEFYFYFKKLPPLYLALVLVALIVRSQPNSTEMYVYLLDFVWRIMVVVMACVTVSFIIRRFIDNFMKVPGALMLTLPVTVWELVASKAIAAFCMVLASIITGLVSAMIIKPGLKDWFLSFLPGAESQGSPVSVDAFIMYFLFIFIMIIQQICLFYAAIIVSHILPRFRFAVGCVIYIVINYYLERPIFGLVNKIDFFLDDMSNTIRSTILLSYTCFAALVFAALFFWASGFLFKRTYNLE